MELLTFSESQMIKKIIYKLLKGIRFLHTKNIIHRDIKPENILLDNEAEIVKLCDFGFTRFLPEKNESMTEYVATRWYRSPELLLGGSYGKPSDIWAVGCILGELVDGQPMFPGEDEVDQLYLIRKMFGELPQEQIDLFRNNKKFENMKLKHPSTTDSLEARYIGKIEKKALSFLKVCLQLDPEKRITVEEALLHPYLVDLYVEENEHLDDEMNLLNTDRNITVKNRGERKQTDAFKVPESNLGNYSQDGNNTTQMEQEVFDESQIIEKQTEKSPEKSLEKSPEISNEDSPKIIFDKNSEINAEKSYENSPMKYGKSVERSPEKPIQKNQDKNITQVSLKTKSKFFQPQRETLKGISGSLPEHSVYKVVNSVSKHNPSYKFTKKFSEIALKAEPVSTRLKLLNVQGSPNSQNKSKMSKAMSEDKKFNLNGFNIDVKVNMNINVRFQEKLNLNPNSNGNGNSNGNNLSSHNLAHNNARESQKLEKERKSKYLNFISPTPPLLSTETKLPEIKATHKILKMKMGNKMPLSHVYKSFGNLTVLGESKEIKEIRETKEIRENKELKATKELIRKN